ncbi:unnamed protein product [Phytophthora lilii]|uniref:non-specific serine/threonine protein kinase n=1 Tax=Phytophthora lilii TaxID=2077276 RepID=A0A9W6TCZ9_9STRA|nr:unnamed protein product [Phytophthora lilii]
MATTACPWQLTTAPAAAAATQRPASPTLQEIMDEELALRLQDEEWVQLVELDDRVLDVEDSEDEFEEKVPAPEQHNDAYEEDDDLRDEDFADDFEDGKGFNSFRETLRRQAKIEGHRGTFLAKARVELSKNGSGVHESMFDEHTQAVLRKLVRKGLVTAVKTQVHKRRGADVFYGVGVDKATGNECELALKIFKTDKADFTKATEYDPTGRRYGLEYVKKSMHRHLKIQTEREYKRLSRAHAALGMGAIAETETQTDRGARIPRPLILLQHMLATEFVGSGGHRAPSLEDAHLNSTQLRSTYTDLLRAVRRLYQNARLVHGCLSVANILFHDDRCWIMGLGRAVEVGAENHLALLTRDLDNLDAFFRSSGVPAVTKRQVGLLHADVAKEYVVAESPEQLLRRFPVLEPLLRD